jgi:hypothetical protein
VEEEAGVIDLGTLARITQNVLDKTGYEAFQPTLLDPASRTVRTLSGVPAEVDHVQALLDWVGRLGLTAYGAAFRVDGGIGLAVVDDGERRFAILPLSGGPDALSECDDLF